MRTYLRSGSFYHFDWVVMAASVGLILRLTGPLRSQVTLAYLFEPDLQSFTGNSQSAAITLNFETSGVAATVGPNSVKVELADFAGFGEAVTDNIHPGFTDSLVLDFIRFDVTNTNRYAPQATVPPTPDVPTLANTSVTFFRDFASDPGVGASIQFFFSEEHIGNLEPGTHEVEIDLTGGGLWNEGGQVKGYDEFSADGFTPFGFQIYFSKNVGFNKPEFAWPICGLAESERYQNRAARCC